MPDMPKSKPLSLFRLDLPWGRLSSCIGSRPLQGDFGLSKFQLGVLAAMFMVGLMVASVLLTQFMGALSPFRLIGKFINRPAPGLARFGFPYHSWYSVHTLE